MGFNKTRHVFIVNPAAGRKSAVSQLTQQIEKAFAARGEGPVIEITSYPGHAAKLAEQYAKAGVETAFYACGGDGTLREVAQGICQAGHIGHCSLGVVPVGSGNDFIRCFGPGAREAFLDIDRLIDGETRMIDLLKTSAGVSVNIVSAGFDASIAQNMVHFKNWPMVSGHAAYQLSLAKCFFTSLNHSYAFEIDETPYEKDWYIFAVAANGRFYGGGFQAAPYASLQDGLIDVILVPSLSRLKVLSMIGHFKNGRHLKRYPFVKFLRCKKIKILTGGIIGLNLDGEIFPAVDPVVEVLPAKIAFRFPKSLATIPEGPEADRID